jgi:hypothetical protein
MDRVLEGGNESPLFDRMQSNISRMQSNISSFSGAEESSLFERMQTETETGDATLPAIKRVVR